MNDRAAWLPIDSYPYDGSWALFRGGLFDHQTDAPPFVVGQYARDDPEAQDRHFIWVCDEADGCQKIWYIDPTEWLPLTAMAFIEPHHVLGLKIAMERAVTFGFTVA